MITLAGGMRWNFSSATDRFWYSVELCNFGIKEDNSGINVFFKIHKIFFSLRALKIHCVEFNVITWSIALA